MGETYLVVVVVVAYGYEPMPELTQDTLFGDRDETHGSLTATNADLFPFLRVINGLVDEVKMDATDTGFYTLTVDPANVGMLEVSCAVDHDMGSFTTGVNVDTLSTLLGNKKREAEVEIEFARPWGSIHVSHGDWEIGERVAFLDPDSVPGRPDREPLEIDLPVAAEVELEPLASYISSRSPSDNIEFRTDENGLFVGSQAGDDEYSAVATTPLDAEEHVSTTFSSDYLKSMIPAIRAIGAETVTLHLGDEFPGRFDFESGAVSGTFALAPRIQG
jgi:hypothetical protein